jgi:hypothetical protein
LKSAGEKINPESVFGLLGDMKFKEKPKLFDNFGKHEVCAVLN